MTAWLATMRFPLLFKCCASYTTFTIQHLHAGFGLGTLLAHTLRPRATFSNASALQRLWPSLQHGSAMALPNTRILLSHGVRGVSEAERVLRTSQAFATPVPTSHRNVNLPLRKGDHLT
ncbi:hypothetical protein B0T22DRAFT_306112 [Podospora appendiculata]|uniref:Secreted protein n=1 Tax=Podospora appendiculata TaxID=314037 RepID=A0AAE1C7H0_9PEZI|nr:hypothetical protein B0T22DRAFT_306112 [Podospora appendiculata]